MSTPDEPQNPDPFRKPEPSDPYGTPPPPAPYGAPQPPAYGTPQPPQHGGPAYPPPPQYPGAPQYGGPVGTPGYGPNPREKNSLAVWALVLGVLSIPCCGIFSAVPAIIVGRRARSYADQGQADNRGLATAGVVLGWIGVAVTVVRVVLAVTGHVDLIPERS